MTTYKEAYEQAVDLCVKANKSLDKAVEMIAVRESIIEVQEKTIALLEKEVAMYKDILEKLGINL